jgi:hypothetical protein
LHSLGIFYGSFLPKKILFAIQGHVKIIPPNKISKKNPNLDYTGKKKSRKIEKKKKFFSSRNFLRGKWLHLFRFLVSRSYFVSHADRKSIKKFQVEKIHRNKIFQKPFPANSMAELVEKVTMGKYNIPDHLNPASRDLIKKVGEKKKFSEK